MIFSFTRMAIDLIYQPFLRVFQFFNNHSYNQVVGKSYLFYVAMDKLSHHNSDVIRSFPLASVLNPNVYHVQ